MINLFKVSLQIHNIKFPEVYLWIFWCANKRSPFLQKRIFVFFVFFLNYAWKLGVRLIHECGLYTSFYGKSFHSLVPSYINKRLIERNSSYNLHDKHSLSIPRVQSTKYGLHSFRYSASKYWNMLPEVLRSAQSLHVFKSKIKSISFDNKCCSFCN